MRAINKVDLSLGSSDINVCIYSAIEPETHFKSLSACCNSPISQKRFCSSCDKEFAFSDLKKG